MHYGIISLQYVPNVTKYIDYYYFFDLLKKIFPFQKIQNLIYQSFKKKNVVRNSKITKWSYYIN